MNDHKNRNRLLAFFTLLVFAYLYMYPEYLEPLLLVAIALYLFFAASLNQWSDRYLSALAAATVATAIFFGFIPMPYRWLLAHHMSFGIAIVLTILAGVGLIVLAIYALSVLMAISRRALDTYQ